MSPAQALWKRCCRGAASSLIRALPTSTRSAPWTSHLPADCSSAYFPSDASSAPKACTLCTPASSALLTPPAPDKHAWWLHQAAKSRVSGLAMKCLQESASACEQVLAVCAGAAGLRAARRSHVWSVSTRLCACPGVLMGR